MAKSSNGLLGNFRGRIGKVVIYEMYGKPMMRSLPTKERKKASKKLKKEQDGFAKVMKYLSPASKFIRIGFRDAAEDTAPFHKAKSWNINKYRNSLTRDPGEWLTFCLGERAGALDLRLEEIAPDRVKVSWGEPGGDIYSGEDEVMLLAVERENHNVIYRLNAGRRKDKIAEIDFSPFGKTKAVDIFIAFHSSPLYQGKKDLRNISTSQWVGELTS